MQSLLETKLYLPELAGDVLPRRRLLARLDQGLGGKLTLVCAPAGFGKTTLAVAWLQSLLSNEDASRAPVRAGWYSVDEHDNDLTTFVSYLAAALRAADAHALSGWIEPDRRPTTPQPEELAVELIQGCLAVHGRLVLVLDDYHFIRDQSIHRLVNHLLRHLPPALHVVITDPPRPALWAWPNCAPATRSASCAPITWRFCRTRPMRFSTVRSRGSIDPGTVEMLWERTEGWAAGLRLAALSLQASDDRQRFVRNFGQRSSRHIADYLVDEVLQSQAPEVHDFLLRTSILERFCGELCAAVLDIEPRRSQATLDTLERSNLFLIGLDDHGEWYRYHGQFRTMLQNRLGAHLAADEVAALHRRAALWLGEHDLVGEALPHFVAAGDLDGAASLVERHIPDLLAREQWRQIDHWLAMLPEELIEQRPALLLLRAWQYEHEFNHGGIKRLVERAEGLLRNGTTQTAEPEAVWGQIHALRISPVFATAPTAETIAHGQEALRLLPPRYAWAHAYALGYLARWIQATGDYPTARQMVEAEIAAAGTTPSGHLVRLHLFLNVLQLLSGNIDDFYRTLVRYEEIARRAEQPVHVQWAQWGLSTVYLERNEPEQALERLRFVFAQPELAEFLTLRLAAHALVGLEAQQGRGDEVQEALAVLRRRLGDTPDANSLKEVDALEAYWALQRGDLAAAERWARSADQDPPVTNLSDRGAIRARVYVALGQPADLERATGLVQDLLAKYRAINFVRSQIAMLVLLARIYRLRRMQQPALAALREAVELGYPRGYRRVFTEQGPLMGEMLHELAREPKFAAMAGSLLAELARVGEVSQPWLRRQAEWHGVGHRAADRA